jgi:prenyl protein peptidase
VWFEATDAFYCQCRDTYGRQHAHCSNAPLSHQASATTCDLQSLTFDPDKILFTLLYVLPFYLSPATRPSPTLNRDAASVIRARIRTVSLACLISSLSTFYLITVSGQTTWTEALHLLGCYTVSPLTSIIRPLFLTTLLFLGPLFEKFITQDSWRAWLSGLNSLFPTLISSVGFRNYVAGPVTEEILFRSVLIPLHLLAKKPPAQIVWLTPLYFGIAHVHHFYEFTLTHPHTPTLPALLRSLFQFGYTTLFGWYASFLYLRTASLVTVILVHSFCNWCGLPRFWGRLRLEAGEPIGPTVSVSEPVGEPGKDDDGDGGEVIDSRGDFVQYEGDGEMALTPTLAYYLLLLAGAYGFSRELWTLTESSDALASFGKRN